MKDYYYILGLASNATKDEIKKAFRLYATKFHPDKQDGDKFFAQKFIEIKEAYDILIDDKKRKAYDSSNKNSSFQKPNNDKEAQLRKKENDLRQREEQLKRDREKEQELLRKKEANLKKRKRLNELERARIWHNRLFWFSIMICAFVAITFSVVLSIVLFFLLYIVILIRFSIVVWWGK